MAFAVKNLAINLYPNESNTFTNSDSISGRVTLEVTKEIRIESFFIKAKGKAFALWSERYSQYSTVVYYDKETCFKSLQYFIEKKKTQEQDEYLLLTDETGHSYSEIVKPGTHVYPFTFQLPHEGMPASFKGYHGKVAYFLEAKLCRSMHIPTKAKVDFNYVPQGEMSIPGLMMPQYGTREKNIKFFKSGSMTMNICIEKMGYCLGEELKVRLDVENNSSRTVKPKFCLYQKQSFFAMKKRKVRTKNLLKEECDPIGPSTKLSMTKVLKIPTEICASILNCRVLKVEYRLKVYLDVKFAADPEVKLPVVVFFPPSTPQKADGVDPSGVTVGFESWTSGHLGWNSCADSGPAASGTVCGIYPRMDGWSEQSGGAVFQSHGQDS